MNYRFGAILAFVLLAGCGGGGGGSASAPPVPAATAQPIANTASPLYAPFRNGNKWTFSSGGYILDAGSGSLVCTCSYNGKPIENWEIYSPSATYGGSYIMAKLSNGANTTFFIGTSTNHAATFSVASDAQGNTGIQVMTDSPVQGTSWSQSGFTSLITNVGGSYTMPDGRLVNNIATDMMSQGSTTVIWGFAKGIGPAQITLSGSTLNLFSFTVDAVNSTAAARAPQFVSVQTGTTHAADALALLEGLR